MSTAARILDDALHLPKRERLELAARLLASAEPPGATVTPASWNAAWGRELDRRWAEAEASGEWGAVWRASTPSRSKRSTARKRTSR